MLIEKKKKEEQLYIAVEEGKTEEVRELISSHRVDVNCQPENKNFYLDATPLIIAACKGQIEMVQILLDSGADINRASRLGSTPLWHSAGRGHEDVVKTLIDRGADLNKADKYGWTPLHNAVMCQRNKIIKLLIDRGADPDRKDSKGRTPQKLAELGIIYV